MLTVEVYYYTLREILTNRSVATLFFKVLWFFDIICRTQKQFSLSLCDNVHEKYLKTVLQGYKITDSVLQLAAVVPSI